MKRFALALSLSMGFVAGCVHAQEQEEAKPVPKPWQLQSVTLIRKGDSESLAKAAELLKKKAEAGDATAQTVLGLRYIVGAGVEKNREEARKHLKNAADQNNRDAQWLLSYCSSDRAEIERCRKAAAENGHSAAQCAMGAACSERAGAVEHKDPEGAFHWYSKAAEQKNAKGLYGLALCYLEGIGVEKNWNKAHELYEQAADLGDMFSMGYYANFSGSQLNTQAGFMALVKDPKGRHVLYAEAGCRSAISNLSRCYRTGWGVPQDDEAALYWLIKAVENGDAFMSRDLVPLSIKGDLEPAVQKEDPLAMFLKGFTLQSANYQNSGPENMNEIIALYQKAAEKKLSHAQYRLALCHEMGQGVEVNVQEAARWYRKAAEQGHTEASYRLARCCEKLGKEKQLKEAVKWYAKAANQGHAQAQYRLGLCFLHGKGAAAKKDAKAAGKWFRMAANRFDIGGLYEMGMMHYSGKGAKKDRKEALRLLSMAGESYGPLCLTILDPDRKPTPLSGCAEEMEEHMARANADALSILYLLRSLKK